jgi:glycosyltransferase involved in cell wall biosynthesis
MSISDVQGPNVDLSIVVPIYNSEATIGTLLSRLHEVLQKLESTFEIILIDDGSRDLSWDRMVALQRVYSETVVVVQLMKNCGQHNAIMCGFNLTRGSYVVTLDDDLQHPPEEIPKLVQAMESNGSDLIYGSYAEKQHSEGRNLGSFVINRFYRIVFRNSVPITSFRIITKRLVKSVCVYDLNFTYIDGLLAWNTDRIGSVVVRHAQREEGTSGYSLSKLLTLALNLFTNFSLLPLQLVSVIGVFSAVSGFLGGAYYFVRYLIDSISVPGYASVIVAILVLGGLQLLSLGIIGEYLGRVHLNLNRRPQFGIREVIGIKEKAN